jgi:hypothetical protein
MSIVDGMRSHGIAECHAHVVMNLIRRRATTFRSMATIRCRRKQLKLSSSTLMAKSGSTPGTSESCEFSCEALIITVWSPES